MRHGILCLVLVAGTSAAVSETPPPVRPAPTDERVLLPILVRDLAGKFGSKWSTRVVAYNGSDQNVEYLPNFVDLSDFPDIGATVLTPRSTREIYVSRGTRRGANGPAVLLYLPGESSNLVDLRLVLDEVSGNFGVPSLEIPVVREREFRTETLNLIGVWGAPGERVMLRIYDINFQSHVEFLVRLFRVEPDEADVLILVTTLTATRDDVVDGHSFWPTVLSFEIPSEFQSATPLRIQVEPLIHGTHFWAFASVTDNVTQEIQLVTPDH